MQKSENLNITDQLEKLGFNTEKIDRIYWNDLLQHAPALQQLGFTSLQLSDEKIAPHLATLADYAPKLVTQGRAANTIYIRCYDKYYNSISLTLPKIYEHTETLLKMGFNIDDVKYRASEDLVALIEHTPSLLRLGFLLTDLGKKGAAAVTALVEYTPQLIDLGFSVKDITQKGGVYLKTITPYATLLLQYGHSHHDIMHITLRQPQYMSYSIQISVEEGISRLINPIHARACLKVITGNALTIEELTECLKKPGVIIALANIIRDSIDGEDVNLVLGFHDLECDDAAREEFTASTNNIDGKITSLTQLGDFMVQCAEGALSQDLMQQSSMIELLGDHLHIIPIDDHES